MMASASPKDDYVVAESDFSALSIDERLVHKVPFSSSEGAKQRLTMTAFCQKRPPIPIDTNNI